MNEVLAILVYAFFQEIVRNPEDKPQDVIVKNKCNENVEEVSASQEKMIGFIFDEGHTFADIYWCFDRVMQFGIKQLY